MTVDHHVLGVHHPVVDLEGATTLLRDGLDMLERRRGKGWVELDNGSISIHLQERDDVSGLPRLVLMIVARDLEATIGALCGHVGIEQVEPIRWATPQRQEARLRTAHRIDLVVVREYDEDELGLTPPLPTTLAWDQDAVEIIQGLMREIPVVFREAARRKTTERAEGLCLEQGDVTVDRTRALRAVIQVTPAFQLDHLAERLTARGVDPGEFSEDFDREGV